ncbi:hypothetical protein BDV95DRAFT_257051 [Massariosphaeria phaeospora]|uniref:Uncharacterized protein n=1 Tax=Massariosphaeria phaeospora TaxID=100035 RepID=A0A7C8I043_9PLEO|nr:hypothetical protein BDV95DRAFT_257051 [Massariosphaeria phaeospora]
MADRAAKRLRRLSTDDDDSDGAGNGADRGSSGGSTKANRYVADRNTATPTPGQRDSELPRAAVGSTTSPTDTLRLQARHPRRLPLPIHNHTAPLACYPCATRCSCCI